MLLPTFCRVTGKSRNLPKPNYFPLLPAISPVEARRLLGKQQQDHHLYVPVIEFARRSPSVLQCHITSHADGEHSYQQPTSGQPHDETGKCRITAKHQVNHDYKYVYPVLNDSNYDTAQLKKLLKRKMLPEKGQQRYVYQVEGRLSLVLPGEMEDAVRTGDIENLLLSKDGSNALVRLKNGPNLSLNLRNFDPPTDGTLLEGGGQDEEVLVKQRQVKQYRKRKISDPRQQLTALTPEYKEEEIVKADWNSRMAQLTAGHRSASNLLVVGTDWRDLLYPQIDTWDWDDIPELTDAPPSLPVFDVAPSGRPPPAEPPVKVSLTEEVIGFETVPVYEERIPVESSQRQPNEEFLRALDKVQAQPCDSIKLKELFHDAESLMVLPFVHEVAAVMEALNRGVPGWMYGNNKDDAGLKFVTKLPEGGAGIALPGLMVPLTGDEQRFVLGQQVPGQGFVPGRSVAGEFRPGCVVQNVEGAAFVPGCLLDRAFVAGQIVENKFVAGQAVQTLFGPKFLRGCTVKSEEGLKFVAGQVVDDKFRSGQAFQTENGPTWVSGVTFDTPQGARFIAGQMGSDGQFVPGQDIDGHFVPGHTLETADGPLFIPGQNYVDQKGEVQFCPGRTLLLDDGQRRFVPGETITTTDGKQFIAGLIQDSKFVPCKVAPDGQISPAEKEGEAFTRAGMPSNEGLPIDNNTLTALPRKKPDMGYMIQHQETVKFLPTDQNPGQLSLPGGENVKVVPGQLMELEDLGSKFVPGKTIESALGSIFIPGQAVKAGQKEQFVPGQVIEAGDSTPMFCPGQMVQCGGELGKRFIPGQVFNTKSGPRFVPGKILTSPSGASTFIPGQVFYTDSGSRFLPGNVVDTEEGPFFVPGRVIDLPGGGIKFIAGEVIQTEEGLRYVAPDESLEQDEELLVQGFPITPEELRLITAYPFASLHYPICDRSVINARMLRQMAAAGVAVNRLTNNVNAANANDVKITADIADESLLGANVFRTTDPETQLSKTAKSKAAKSGNKVSNKDGLSANDASAAGQANQNNQNKAEMASKNVVSNNKQSSNAGQDGVNGDDSKIGGRSGGDNGLGKLGADGQMGDANGMHLHKANEKTDQVSTGRAQNVSSMHALSESDSVLLTDVDSSANGKAVQKQQPAPQGLIGSGGGLTSSATGDAGANASRSDSTGSLANNANLAEGQRHQHDRTKGSTNGTIEASSASSSSSAFNGSGDEGSGRRMAHGAKESLGAGQNRGNNANDPTRGVLMDGAIHSLPGTEASREERQGQQRQEADKIGDANQDLLLSKAGTGAGTAGNNTNDISDHDHDQHGSRRSGLSPVSEFFARIKTDMDSLEEDPYVRQTLLEAENMALGSGRPDLADRVKQLMDILKNTEQDPDVISLLRFVLTPKPVTESVEQSAANGQLPDNAGPGSNGTALGPDGVTASDALSSSNEAKDASVNQDLSANTQEGPSALGLNGHVGLDGPSGTEPATANQSALSENAVAGATDGESRSSINAEGSGSCLPADMAGSGAMRDESGSSINAEGSGSCLPADMAGSGQQANDLSNLKDDKIDGPEEPLSQSCSKAAMSEEENGSKNSASAGSTASTVTKPSRKSKSGGKNAGDPPIHSQQQQLNEEGLTDASIASDQVPNGKLEDATCAGSSSSQAASCEDATAAGGGDASQSGGMTDGNLTLNGLPELDPTDLELFNQNQTDGVNGSADEVNSVDLKNLLNNGEDAALKRMNGNNRRRRGAGRRVTSRSSSRSFVDIGDLSEEEYSESLTATMTEDAREPEYIPEIITSAKDISREVIDTLRYSRDAAKKELFTQQILEALNPGSRKGSSACIILKDFLQTIVPQEAAHNVLVGDIDYMVVDDEGVRYFESASVFASRRNSRFDIRQSSRSNSTGREPSAEGPWPWADVGPRATNKNRRMSIDEFRKKLQEQDKSLEPRAVPHGRHSVAGYVPISRSNSGFIPQLSSPISTSRRASILSDDLAIQAATAVIGRKRQRPPLPPPDPSSYRFS